MKYFALVAGLCGAISCSSRHPSDTNDGDIDVVTDDGTDDVPDDVSPRVYGLDSRPPNTTCQAFTAPPVTGEVTFVDRFPNIAFTQPVAMHQRPNDNSRIYVNERDGHVYSFPNDPSATMDEVTLALDLSDVIYTSEDCSAASFAFPPDFESTHVAYINYCLQSPHSGYLPHVQIRLSRFTSNDGGLTFDRDSEQVVVAVNYHESDDEVLAGDPYPQGCTHNPNQDGMHATDSTHFGSDGYLYMTLGDGGPQGECGGKEAQSLSQLRGKLLRMDVSDLAKEIPSDQLAFNDGMQLTALDVPPDNPFFGPDPNPSAAVDPSIIQPYIWAYGFRNPWWWTFDSKDGAIWLGDVGNNDYEEIDRAVQKGGNYGWGYFEGYYCSNGWQQTDCDAHAQCTQGYTTADCDAAVTASQLPSTYTFPPFLAYNHGSGEDEGAAVTGGVVYRGTGVPSATGSYFFADSQYGHIWSVATVDSVPPTGADCTTVACPDGLTCIANSGAVFNMGVDPAYFEPRCQAPKTLVKDGIYAVSFAADQTGETYAVDIAAGKLMMLQAVAASGGSGGPPSLLSQTGCFSGADASTPVDDLLPYEPAAQLWSDGATKRRWMTIPADKQVTLAADGDFLFPDGTVLVKEFSLAGARVETRFLVKQTADGRWAGYSYTWNDAGTDATLTDENGATKTWGAQTWAYPSRSQCFQCHNAVANTSLGLEAIQLNHDITYPSTGRTDNQMDVLAHIGIVDPTNAPGPYASLAPIGDTTRTTEDRARSYLHANCSICHRPGGPTYTPADMRYETSFADMHVCNQAPTISDLAGLITPPPEPVLFLPGDPAHSEIYVRLDTTEPQYRMPPLARTITDATAAGVISDWITTTTSCPAN